ncbi:MAG: 6-bladed beta-propeller, partial [Odoribacter sp.]|nr:6-bladed beta-propeller [Odoribacter sp.]
MMKWLVFLLFCALLCSCGKQVKNEGIPVVELRKAVGKIDLKLSDLLENIRVIPLETRPDILLPGYPSFWVGEKYIVTYGGDAMHLFTVDGKYVRKLAEQGRGPEEYLYAMGFSVDKQERYGYLADRNGCISVIDLEKGGIARRISIGKNIPYNLCYSDKDSTLVYAPVGKDNLACTIYRIALDGTLLHTVES